MTLRATFRILLAGAIAVHWAAAASSVLAVTYEWTGGDGTWSSFGTTPGWSGGPGPTVAGDVVQRTTPLAASILVDQNVDATVGSIKIGNGTNLGTSYFWIRPASGKLLNMNNNGSEALIQWNNASTTGGELYIQSSTDITTDPNPGTLNLQGNLRIANLQTTASTVSRGSIQIWSSITGTGNITISNAQPIPTTDTEIRDGIDCISLTGTSNAYVGDTTIEKGAVNVEQPGAFGTGTIYLGSNASQSAAILRRTTNVNPPAIISNPIVVAAADPGITRSIINASSSAGISATFSGPITLNGNLTLGSRSGAEVFLVTGNISGSGGLIFPSTAAFTASRQVRISGSNTYAGDTLIGGQTVVVRNGNAIPNGPGTGVLTVNGTLRLGYEETINGLNGTGTVGLVSTPRTLTIGDNNADGLFSGAIVDGVSIAKTGNGTQIFSGANTYSGATSVNAGTLLVDGTHTGGGAYSVAEGATLGGNVGNIGSNVTVLSGGTLAPGDAGIGTLTVASAQLFTGSQLTIKYDGAAQTISTLDVPGSLDITGATLDLQNLSATALASGALPFATYGSLTGTFDSTLNLPAGFSLDYNYQGSNEIALVSIPPQTPGDFNGDGLVNGADFSVWQGSFPTTAGANLAGGDADGDGDVDGADFIVWQTHYSPGGGASPATSAVPEPTGISLLAIAALVGCAWLRTQEKAIRLPT